MLIAVGSAGLILLLAAAAAAFVLVGRTVRGAVVSLATDQPVSGATVASAYGAAVTDDSGRFVLSKLRLGTHAVTVTVDGYAPFKASLRVAAFGGGENQITLPDASVIVHLEEAALQPKTVTSATVDVGGKAASAAASGTYELKGVRPGDTTVTVTGPSHEATKATVRLRPGTNDVTVSLRLTPAETYARYFAAYKAGQWKAAYSYLHPDVAELESLETYTKDMRDWGTPVSITMQKTTMLPKWTSPYTKRTYANVAEITRTLVSEKDGVRLVTALPQHWANVGGVWLRVDI